MRRETNKDVRGEGRGRGTPSLLQYYFCFALAFTETPATQAKMHTTGVSQPSSTAPVLSRRVTLKKPKS